MPSNSSLVVDAEHPLGLLLRSEQVRVQLHGILGDALLVADVALVIDEDVEAEDQAGDEQHDGEGFDGEFAHGTDLSAIFPLT